MVKWNLPSERKPTGGLANRNRKKMRMDRRSEFLETRLEERTLKNLRGKGGSSKVRLLSDNVVNLATKGGKVVKTKILTVVENPANPHYVRRNVITKGAVIKTESGLARVTSRPSGDGIINAVLIEEKK